MATTTSRKTPRRRVARKPAATAAAAHWKRVARPDPPDARDRPFRPNVAVTPAQVLFPKHMLPVKHQGQTFACTGFGLSLVVEHLLRASGRERAPAISPYMLYSMARRYDEFPGSVEDAGSSLRGALKGWYKHGACALGLFPELAMPPASDRIEDDWWYDAVRRPLGAYYRVDPRSIVDMHSALNEVGVLYASCGCHSGWDEGVDLGRPKPRSYREVWTIPVQGGSAAHDGHAFAIVGYNEQGFLIQNSWGDSWGSGGFGLLSYGDWLANAMDCWVAQLGVVTTDHLAISRSLTLRTERKSGRVLLAANEELRSRELAPFIVNMGNNGQLSNSGDFRTTADDVRALVEVHLKKARELWKPADGIIDVCLYAHGGLVDEKAAAETAASWIPMLYDAKIFPIFLMWETDFLSTLAGRIEDALLGIPRTTGASSGLARWWNRRLEQALARPGTSLWGEMKQNADAISAYRDGRPVEQQPGALQVWHHFRHNGEDRRVRLHFVGHSAGSIVAAFAIDRLVRLEGLQFESLSLLAPAVRVDTFERLLLPHLESRAVRRMQQFHLSERAEEDDPTCGPYRRSLLHLVSESFEGGATAPILGMQKWFDPLAARAKLPNTTVHVAPGATSGSSTHGGFDNDPRTRAEVLKFVRGGTPLASS
ncbi:MAG: C1 family peptidase [Rubrivivax sp.]|jgi:hypothetical protein|nr:C1 family peptidase [Rubrivivax sp.]